MQTLGGLKAAWEQTWNKTIFLHKQNRCVNYNKGEFATKKRKRLLTTTMSKIGPPHDCRGAEIIFGRKHSKKLNKKFCLYFHRYG